MNNLLKGQRYGVINFIIRKRKLIERIFFIIFTLCALSSTLVGVNYDLTKYLPESTESSKALSILKQEFTYPGTGRVMLENVSLYEAKALKDRIESVDGVDMVMML